MNKRTGLVILVIAILADHSTVGFDSLSTNSHHDGLVFHERDV